MSALCTPTCGSWSYGISHPLQTWGSVLVALHIIPVRSGLRSWPKWTLSAIPVDAILVGGLRYVLTTDRTGWLEISCLWQDWLTYCRLTTDCTSLRLKRWGFEALIGHWECSLPWICMDVLRREVESGRAALSYYSNIKTRRLESPTSTRLASADTVAI